MTDLTPLISRLKQAMGPDRELDALIEVSRIDSAHNYGPLIYSDGEIEFGAKNEIGGVVWCKRYKVPAYTADLNAYLPGDEHAHWIIDGPRPEGWYATRSEAPTDEFAVVTEGVGATEVLARRIASLKAIQAQLQETADPSKKHPSHETRISDASSFDEICIVCGATDRLGSWGALSKPCPGKEE